MFADSQWNVFNKKSDRYLCSSGSSRQPAAAGGSFCLGGRKKQYEDNSMCCFLLLFVRSCLLARFLFVCQLPPPSTS